MKKVSEKVKERYNLKISTVGNVCFSNAPSPYSLLKNNIIIFLCTKSNLKPV